MNIIIDLDGTLIDSKLRLYRLFQYLAPKSKLTFEQYWDLKSRKISNEIILKKELSYDNEMINKFVYNWMSLIETKPYLVLDSCFDGTHKALLKLQNLGNLFLCTSRQLRQPTLDQLYNLNLLQFFKLILITEQRLSKESLIKESVLGLSGDDWLVGDTGKDILAGKSLNLKTCAVLSGFLNAESLNEYNPDIIHKSVFDFCFDITNKIS